MNVKARAVELRTSKHTTDSGALQKGEDFVKAFTLGFDVDGAPHRSRPNSQTTELQLMQLQMP